MMERYDRDLNNLFDLPSPGLFVLCERVREEAEPCKKRHEHALKGHFAIRQGKKKCLDQKSHLI